MILLNKALFQIQCKRGLVANINVSGTRNQAVEGELHFATDTKDIYIFDGTNNVLVGGVQALEAKVSVSGDEITGPIIIICTTDNPHFTTKAHASQTQPITRVLSSSDVLLAGHDSRGILFSSGSRDETNSYMGKEAGYTGASGTPQYITGIGYRALRYAYGSSNTSVGAFSGGLISSEVGNSIFGYGAGKKGNYNCIFGHLSAYSLEADRCIFIGPYSGYRQTTTSNLLIVDNLQRADAATEQTNAILYGVMAATPASQSLRANADVRINVYQQTTEPTINTDKHMAIWEDTDDSNRVYLVYRRGTGDQVKIELV